MDIDRGRAKTVAADAFRAHGISDRDAEVTAEVLVTANARGKGSHGLIRLPRYLRGLEHGNVDPEGEIEIIRDSGAAATLTGGSRLGPPVALEATAEASARAEEYGVGAIGVQDGNHLGMLGYYTDHARREGHVAIAMTNTEPAMPPYGGANPILGTNPIAIGLPTEPPFNLDMSTSSIARGTLNQAAERGESIPEGVALDASGAPTTDPSEALSGTIRPFGGPKGSGLAIAIEVLAGGLVGAAMGTNVTGTYNTEMPCTKGDLFIVFDPQALGGDEFVEQANMFLESLTAIETDETHDAIRLPGERAIREERTDRITVDEDIWDDVCELAGVGP
jgi:L-2-hydroxycarboxylate dehydrogenase (NAD+)